MLKINYMSTLFVGIDVSSKSNMVYAMDFDENKYISSFPLSSTISPEQMNLPV